LALLTLPAGILAASGWPVTFLSGDPSAGLLVIALLLGCWLDGLCLAGVVSAAEWVAATFGAGPMQKS
jgi:hypothetical protein